MTVALGYYIPGEAVGAIPNGTRIMKTGMEEGDSTRLGSLGTVLSSMDTSDVEVENVPHVDYFYFVIWDWMPNVPVGVMDWKIGRADA